ncbi:MAG: glycosyltransferase [Pseudomonadota bacterium]
MAVRVHLLTEGFRSSNVRAALYPLIRHRRQLADAGVRVRLFSAEEASLADCDLLVAESKWFADRWTAAPEAVLEQLSRWRRHTGRLAYLDTADSTALLHPRALEVVDAYWKAQLLADRSHYTRPHYGNRLFTDHAHRVHGIADAEPAWSEPVAAPEMLAKLRVSWNSGLADWSVAGRYLSEAYARLPLRPLLRAPGGWGDPWADRPIAVSCRMGVSYRRETVAWQRRRAQSLLAPWARADRVGYRAYVGELRRARVVVSPFGWGEINYKDYETFLAGACLVKPDMGHLETWPDLYRAGETIAAYGWDGDDLVATIEALLADPRRAAAIADAGQRQYARHVTGPEAAGLFVEQVVGLVRQ